MKIKSISISGMHNVDKKVYTFDDVNYLYGSNGAGKSTVLNAIQLVILGYLPGTAKKSSEIFKHANGPVMDINLELDDNTHIHRTWSRKGRSIECSLDTDINFKDPTELAGELELPIFNFNELINLSANKLKDWFINFLPDASSELNWRNELVKSLDNFPIMDDDLLDKTIFQINTIKSSSTLNLIQQINAYFKEEQSFLKKELQRADATIQSLVYYDEEDLTGDSDYLDNQIQTINDQIKSITAERDRAVAALQVIESNRKIRNQLATISTSDADISELKKKAEILQDEIEKINATLQGLDAKIKEKMCKQSEYGAEIKIKNDIISKNGICPYTQSKCNSIVSMIEQLKVEITDIVITQDKLKSEIAEHQSQAANLRLKLNQKQNELYQLNSRISAIQNNEAMKNNLQNLLAVEPDISKFKDLREYTAEIEKCHEYITKIEANKRYSSLIDKFTSDKYKIENTIEVYKVWIKLTDSNGLQTRIMDQPFKEFESSMNQYLSILFDDDFTFKFNLEHKVNSFSFGIVRDNAYIPYDLLSSGEKTMFTLAMMICIINKSNAKLKTLIVDDMLDHLDDNRANEVFSAIQHIEDTQIIMAGVKQSSHTKDYIIHIN